MSKIQVNMSAKLARYKLIKQNVTDHITEQAMMGYSCIACDIITGIEDDALDAKKIARELATELEIELIDSPEIIFRIPQMLQLNQPPQEDGI